MHTFKRLTSTVLLITLIAQCIGWVVVYHGVRKQARREVRARIMQGVPEHECMAFTMLRDEIGIDTDGRQWEHDGEFKFNDVMYDVVRIVEEADHVVVLAIADLKESHLYQQIALETKKKIPGTAATSPIAKLAAEVLGKPFLHPTSGVLRPSTDVRRPSHRETKTPDVGRRTLDVPTPPPEGSVALV
jgi:hypothetical protein